MIRGIHHIGLHSRNIERMLRFYRDGLGFALKFDGNWQDNVDLDHVLGLQGSAGRVVVLNAGNLHLELFEFSAPEPRDAPPLRACDFGYTHIGLDVTDVDAAWDQLSALGITFDRRPVDLGPVKLIYGKDPDGNLLEIQEFIDKDHPTHFNNLKMPVLEPDL